MSRCHRFDLPGEELVGVAGRMDRARKLEREIADLERRLAAELGFSQHRWLAGLVTTKTEDARGQVEDALARPD